MRLLATIILLTLTGCACYREKCVSYYKDGTPRQETVVTYRTCLMSAKASRFASSTRSEDFVRTVNSDNPQVNVDADSVKAITEGVTAAVLKAVTHMP